MFKKLHVNYQNNSNKKNTPFLSEPIDGNQEIHRPELLKPIDTHSPNYIQPWNGYNPKCTLADPKCCEYLPSQTANIKVDNIYQNIEVQGNQWMKMACEEAKKSVESGGGPFGAVILQIDNQTNEIIRYWKNHNQVTRASDPTAHAEVMTIKSACASLGVYNLNNIEQNHANLPQPNQYSHCVIYSSAEPCPMCFSAICWANIPHLYFAATRFDAAAQGVNFSDEEIYNEITLPYSQRKNVIVRQCTTNNSLSAFNLWKRTPNTHY